MPQNWYYLTLWYHITWNLVMGFGGFSNCRKDLFSFSGYNSVGSRWEIFSNLRGHFYLLLYRRHARRHKWGIFSLYAKYGAVRSWRHECAVVLIDYQSIRQLLIYRFKYIFRIRHHTLTGEPNCTKILEITLLDLGLLVS